MKISHLVHKILRNRVFPILLITFILFTGNVGTGTLKECYKRITFLYNICNSSYGILGCDTASQPKP
jgi:hypothetical protein